MTDLEYIMSEDSLREEVRRAWDREIAVSHDFKSLPEVPSVETMLFLSSIGFEPWWSLGKATQRQHPFGTVPSKTECEIGMGAWSVIRPALLKAKEGSSHD